MNKCKILYFSLSDEMRKEEKLEWFSETKFEDIDFERIKPDKNGYWINQTDNDWDSLIPLIHYDVKNSNLDNTIFKTFSNGIATNRDAWVYDIDSKNLEKKINHFINRYNDLIDQVAKDQITDKYPTDIKWSHALKNKFRQSKYLVFDSSKITWIYYRPFKKMFYYCDFDLSDAITTTHFEISGKNLNEDNQMIWFKCGLTSYFFSLGINKVHDIMPNGGSKCLPLYRYEKGEKVENITDWALALFREKYSLAMVEDLANALSEKRLAGSSTTANEIEKTDIFHYVYAVLHDPKYRTKYAQNLKREFPRIPLYADFWKYANSGKKLMDLHLNYEKIEGRELRVENRVSRVALSSSLSPLAPRTKLKANKETGEIYIDEITTLTGIPPLAWEYKLGNRSALEWILDQYKEKKPSDPTILEKFNTYKFADYKEEVIELLQKVCAVSVRTMEIVNEL